METERSRVPIASRHRTRAIIIALTGAYPRRLNSTRFSIREGEDAAARTLTATAGTIAVESRLIAIGADDRARIGKRTVAANALSFDLISIRRALAVGAIGSTRVVAVPVCGEVAVGSRGLAIGEGCRAIDIDRIAVPRNIRLHRNGLSIGSRNCGFSRSRRRDCN